MKTTRRYPSVKVIREHLLAVGFTADEARIQAPQLRWAMETRKGLVYYSTVRNLYGVEYIALPDGCLANCEPPDHSIGYANTGDTYGHTLVNVDGRYVFGNWGDYVERWS